jgi:hypothetical protein
MIPGKRKAQICVCLLTGVEINTVAQIGGYGS